MSGMNARTQPGDEVRRFIVENRPVRGHWVRLESAWQELRAHKEYPEPVRELLGQAVAASVLLAATLKFSGTLTFQLWHCCLNRCNNAPIIDLRCRPRNLCATREYLQRFDV